MSGLQQHDPNEDGTWPHKCLRVTLRSLRCASLAAGMPTQDSSWHQDSSFSAYLPTPGISQNATIRPLLSTPQQIMVQRETGVPMRKKPVVKSALSQLQVLRFHLTDEMSLLASGHGVASFYRLLMCLARLHLAAEVSTCIHNIIYHT